MHKTDTPLVDVSGIQKRVAPNLLGKFRANRCNVASTGYMKNSSVTLKFFSALLLVKVAISMAAFEPEPSAS
jgi:hypothetical protein